MKVTLKSFFYFLVWRSFLITSFFASLNTTAFACDQAYIEKMSCGIVDAKKDESGPSSEIPNSVIIGQAVLESASGKSVAAKKKNNHFGLISPKTKKVMSFKSTEMSIETYLATIDNNKAYKGLRKTLKQKGGKDYKVLVAILSNAYAEDNRYQQKLLGVIDRCELRRFDGYY